MYTMDCTNPSCIHCKQTAEGKGPLEEVQSKILKPVEEFLSRDLLSISREKADCLDNYKKLKDEICYKIGNLIGILKERERDLCIELEQHYALEVAKLHNDIALGCLEKLTKRDYKIKKISNRMQLFFISDFDVLKKQLQNFGCLSYEKTSESLPLNVRMHEIDAQLKEYHKILEQFASPTLHSYDPIELNFETEYSTENVSLAAFDLPITVGSKAISRPEKEKEKIDVLGKNWITEKCPDLADIKDIFEESAYEEDIEFINGDEATSIPDVLFCSTPSKNQSWFYKKCQCFTSSLPRSRNANPLFSSDEDAKLGGIANEMISQKSFTASQSVSTGNTEKEDEKESIGHMSSYFEYLEKTAESDWLAPVKSSEQVVSSIDSCIVHEPLVKKDISLSEWLPKKDVIETNADWLLHD